MSPALPPKSARRRIQQLIVAALGAAAIFVAARQALSDQDLLSGDPAAALRWSGLSSDGATFAGNEALRMGRTARARSLAIRAIEASPVNVGGITLLAQVDDSQKDQDRSGALWTAASAMGFENPDAQLWELRQALAQRDLSTALVRAEALARLGIRQEQMFALLRFAANDPEALKLLVSRLELGPPWRSQFLESLKGLSPPTYTQHRAILLALMRSQRPPSATEVDAFVGRLVSDKQYQQANRAWHLLEGREGNFQDGQFRALSAKPDGAPVFGWKLSSLIGVTADPSIDGLRLAADGSAAGLVLSQLTVLAPGNYRLRWEVHEQALGSSSALHWKMMCAESDTAIEAPQPTTTRGSTGTVVSAMTFAVPQCPAVHLQLWIFNQAPQRLDAVIRRVDLTRE